jgi:hypothetical protein
MIAGNNRLQRQTSRSRKAKVAKKRPNIRRGKNLPLDTLLDPACYWGVKELQREMMTWGMPGNRSRALRINQQGFVYEVRREDGTLGPIMLADDDSPIAIIVTPQVDKKREPLYAVTAADLARAYEAAFEKDGRKCAWQLYREKRTGHYSVRFMLEGRHPDGRRKRDKRYAARELYKLWKNAPQLARHLRITVKQGEDGLGHALDLRPRNLELLKPDSSRKKPKKKS